MTEAQALADEIKRLAQQWALAEVRDTDDCATLGESLASAIDRLAAMAQPATPNAALPPLGDGPRKKIAVTVEVPENWGKRLDMQWVLEREIQADRWSWNWPKLRDRRPSLWAMQAREALELIAAPCRPDGSWNRDREACRRIAAEVLGLES